MSLDVMLYEPREDSCQKCGHVTMRRGDELFSRNVTHNLGSMAQAAGIYHVLWRPDECSPPITRAKQLIEPLTEGLARLRADPEKFKALNPANGWGSYEGLVEFVDGYRYACKEFPDALVGVWR